MQDALPASVLRPEDVSQNAMTESPSTSPDETAPGSLTDEQLMLEFSKGSAAAFAELFSRYKQPLFGFFRRRLADPNHAEELTQETFLAIVRASSRYVPRALFRTYLYAIAFKILRAHRRKAAFRAAFLGNAPGHRDPAARDSADIAFLIRHAIAKLDATDREVLLLREFEQLSYAEIAEVLHLPVNTVRSRLFRAREALHDLLAAPADKRAPTTLAESEEHV
ncbi:MAG TPA: sigma-70 family RNA polymerase sigma factor [Candidatus Acidoferrum sp.]